MGGGVIVTNREDLAKAVGGLIASFPLPGGMNTFTSFWQAMTASALLYPPLFWLPVSLPFLHLGETLYEPDFPLSRLPFFHSQLGKKWKARLARHQRARKKNCLFWRAQLPEKYFLICQHAESALIRLPVLAPGKEVRDDILEQSKRIGLGLMPSYPAPINEIPQLAQELGRRDYPRAKNLCQRLFTIPVHEYMKNSDNERILSLLRNPFDGSKENWKVIAKNV